MRISDWSSDVCSSDLLLQVVQQRVEPGVGKRGRIAVHHASRRAVVTGWVAARRAGNRPPTKPTASAHFRPVHSPSGETLNATVSWPRPEERRDGKECVSTGSIRGGPLHKKKKN